MLNSFVAHWNKFSKENMVASGTNPLRKTYEAVNAHLYNQCRQRERTEETAKADSNETCSLALFQTHLHNLFSREET